MDTQGCEEVDFENVTDRVTLLSAALTDITQQLEQEVRAGASDLNAVGVQLGNLHARIGEDSLYNPLQHGHRMLTFISCDGFQFSRHARSTPRPFQGKSRIADFVVPRSLSSRRCPRFEPSSWQAPSVLGPHQFAVDFHSSLFSLLSSLTLVHPSAACVWRPVEYNYSHTFLYTYTLTPLTFRIMSVL